MVTGLLAVGLLGGCGNSEENVSNGETTAGQEAAQTAGEASEVETNEVASVETGEEIILKFPCIWVGTDSKAEVFGQMINDFNEENAGAIKIVVEEQTDYDAYRDKLRTQLSTGSAPDIFTVDSYADLELFAQSGKLMDITEFLGSSDISDRFIAGLIENAKVEGANYGMPYENAYIPMMYNMGLLEQAGVTEVPTSYDEFFEVCQKLKDAGIFPTTQMTNDNAWTSMLWYSYAVASCGGPDVYENGLDDPAFVEAAEIMKKMFEYTSPDAIGADATVVNGHFFNERAAIYTNGTWILGRIKSEGVEGLYDNINIGPSLATANEEGGGYLNVVQAYICAADQEDPAKAAAVTKFMEFVTAEEKIVDLSNSSGSTFAIATDVANITNPLQAEIITAATDAKYTIGSLQAETTVAITNAFPAALESLIIGDVDAQGFVDMLKAAK